MSNARKLSKLVVGTEVKATGVDSDLSTTISNLKTRLDSDDSAVQALSITAAALTPSGLTDSDLKVVADLRSQLDSEILSSRSLSLDYTNYIYTATAGQTTFTGSDDNSATLSYTVGSIQVFLNGILLDGSDYTATSGTSIVLNEAAALNNELAIIVPRIHSTYVPAAPATPTSYTWEGTVTEVGFLTARNRGANDYFGWDVAMDEDGGTLVVSAPYEDTGGSNYGAIYTFNKTTNGTTARASFDSESPTLTSNSDLGNISETAWTSLDFNNDGTKIFLVGYGTDKIYQFSLATAYDVTGESMSYDSASYDFTELSAPRDFKFNNDGTKIFLTDSNNNRVYEYSLGTAFDVSTLSYSNNNFSPASQGTQAKGLEFNSDGTKMYVSLTGEDRIAEYDLTTGFSLASGNISHNQSIDLPLGEADSMKFNSDGTKLFIVDNSENDIFQYNLTTAYDISTAYQDKEGFNRFGLSLSSKDTLPEGITLNADNTKAYIIGQSNDKIFQYDISGTQYVQTQQINKANMTEVNSYFGWCIDISNDGNTIVAGNRKNSPVTGGCLALFTRADSSSSWVEDSELVANDAAINDDHGEACAISGDGNTIAGGAPRKSTGTSGGAVYIFTKDDYGDWSQQAKITPNTAAVGSGDADFGKAVTLSEDGNTIAIGAPGRSIASGSIQGHVEVWVRDDTTWSHQRSITQSSPSSRDGFGWTVSLGGDTGDTLAIGQHYENANDEGNCWIFQRSDSDGGTTWSQEAVLEGFNITDTEDFGINVSLSNDGNRVLVGAQADGISGDEGTAFLFRRGDSDGGVTWGYEKRISASNAGNGDVFGYAVSLSGDGGKCVVGAYKEDTGGTDAGAAYVFEAEEES